MTALQETGVLLSSFPSDHRIQGHKLALLSGEPGIKQIAAVALLARRGWLLEVQDTAGTARGELHAPAAGDEKCLVWVKTQAWCV